MHACSSRQASFWLACDKVDAYIYSLNNLKIFAQFYLFFKCFIFMKYLYKPKWGNLVEYGHSHLRGLYIFLSFLGTYCLMLLVFIYYLLFVYVICKCSHFQVERENHAAPSLQLNVIRLLADLNSSVKRPEVVDMILPKFIESLEERDASIPGLLRLRVWSSLFITNIVHLYLCFIFSSFESHFSELSY